jgi:O-antigen ligase
VEQVGGLPTPVVWLLMTLSLLAALVIGFLSQETLVLSVAALGATTAFLGFFFVPVSVPLKLTFLLILLSFLQRLLGYFKLGNVRGLNVGNIVLAGTMLYWFLRGLKTRRWYRPTPMDLWVFLAAIVIPSFSIFYALVFRRVDGYSMGREITWYKQWVTPFLYFFFLSQCFNSRREIRLLFVMVGLLVSLAILESLPDVMRMGHWLEGRSEGFVGQPNDFAALLAVTAPFFLLVVLLMQQRPLLRVLCLLLLGGMAASILSTYSRAGYVGFALAFVGALMLAYRSTGRITLGLPILVMTGACLLPLAIAPDLIDTIQERFTVKTYQRAQRQSYSQYRAMDRYAGGRLEFWKAALRMAEQNPVFGVGFHAFEKELPRYHTQGEANYPHNQFIGALAEGGVIWLTAMLVLFWKFLKFLYQSWRITLSEKDLMGQIICGGALLSFIVMTWIAQTNDFFNPGPKNLIFWVTMAAAVKYAMLPPGEDVGVRKAAAFKPGASARGG